MQHAHAIRLPRMADGLPDHAETDRAQAEEEAPAGRDAIRLHSIRRNGPKIIRWEPPVRDQL
jgi:hypothetical protein